MPIYEYTCQKCAKRVEVIQKASDKPPKRCADCGGKLEKAWSQTSFQLKGSGWYVTDYAGKKAEAKDGKGDGKSDDKADAKAKPAKDGDASTANGSGKSDAGDKAKSGDGDKAKPAATTTTPAAAPSSNKSSD